MPIAVLYILFQPVPNNTVETILVPLGSQSSLFASFWFLFDVCCRVEAGETLAIIAAKYKTTAEDIIVLNKVSNNLVKRGPPLLVHLRLPSKVHRPPENPQQQVD